MNMMPMWMTHSKLSSLGLNLTKMKSNINWIYDYDIFSLIH